LGGLGGCSARRCHVRLSLMRSSCLALLRTGSSILLLHPCWRRHSVRLCSAGLSEKAWRTPTCRAVSPPPTPPPPALPCRMARGNLAAAGPSQGSMQVIQGVFGAPPGGAVLSPREGAPPCRSVRSHAPPVFTPNATVTSPSPPPRLTSLPS
jgi:hypothetical protein